MTLSESFSLFFAEMTVEEAAERLAEKAQIKIEVDAALAANNWPKLNSLGFAIKEYHPTQELTYRWQFNQKQYDTLVADLKMTAEQFADSINSFDN